MKENELMNVHELTMCFGGLTAVSKVNIKINQGELVGLIGPNGAGKTTCFNMLTGVYVPTSGSIKFAGESINNTPPHKICHKGIARTFQNIRLFKEMTVVENVLISLHKKRNYNIFSAIFRTPNFHKREIELRNEALELLAKLQLDKKADWLACNLPYGEQRKLEIARALAINPQLLLLDEPAAGMNPSETAQLADFIGDLRKHFSVTILLIEHDMSLVMKICERLYVLDYGELIAQGLPADIKKNPKVIEAYLGGSLSHV